MSEIKGTDGHDARTGGEYDARTGNGMTHCYEPGIPVKVFDEIMREYGKAVRKHPDSTWPKDVVHMTAIMAEEAGEAVQAANDVLHGGASLEPLRRELAQTAAMCVRCLVNLEGK